MKKCPFCKMDIPADASTSLPEGCQQARNGRLRDAILRADSDSAGYCACAFWPVFSEGMLKSEAQSSRHGASFPLS
jgi:hypothetical protein